LVECCEQAGVLVLWTSLLNCTRSVRSQTGTKEEKGLLLLRVLLSFFSNRAYKYLPPSHALLRLRSTKEDVGQLFNKAGQAPSPRTTRRYAKALVENHEKSISDWICEDLEYLPGFGDRRLFSSHDQPPTSRSSSFGGPTQQHDTAESWISTIGGSHVSQSACDGSGSDQ